MTVVSVFGSGKPQPGSADYVIAQQVGQDIAEAGWIVQTGGYSGVMAGASQGANEAGGHVIGITCEQIETYRPMPPNQWVKEEIKYPTLSERLLHVVKQCDAIIILSGGIGTLAELALAWNLIQTGEIENKPAIAVGGLWARTLSAFITTEYVSTDTINLIQLAKTPKEALDLLKNTL